LFHGLYPIVDNNIKLVYTESMFKEWLARCKADWTPPAPLTGFMDSLIKGENPVIQREINSEVLIDYFPRNRKTGNYTARFRENIGDHERSTHVTLKPDGTIIAKVEGIFSINGRFK